LFDAANAHGMRVAAVTASARSLPVLMYAMDLEDAADDSAAS
jgi:hypothetical protein